MREENAAADFQPSPPGGDALVVPPPWHLSGSAILLLHDWRSLLALVHYDASPVGSYNEMALITLTRHGPTVPAMWVNSRASMLGGRRNWGFPKQLRDLHWLRREQRIEFRARSHRQKLGRWRVRAWGFAVPVRFRAWSAQTLEGQLVRAPLQLHGYLRLGWRGRQLALFMEHFEMTMLSPQAVES